MIKRYELEHSIQEALTATVTIDGAPTERKLFMVTDVSLSVQILDLTGGLLTLYSDETGTSTVANPLTADPDTGRIEAWTEAPDYDIVVSGTGIDTYTQYVRTSPHTNVKSYGAVGNGIADDTDAIQAALDSEPDITNDPSGAHLIFPHAKDYYRVDGRLDINGRTNVTFEGYTLSTANESTIFEAPSRINFTQSGTASCIDARSTYAFHIVGMAISYDNVDYRGTVIDLSHNAGGSDSQRFKITDSVVCGIGSAYNAKCLISNLNCIFSRHVSTDFGKAVAAIRFREGGYANVITLTANAAIGAATYNVTDTSAYPASGTFLIRPYNRRTAPETITYTGKTATSFTGCSGGTLAYLSGDETMSGTNSNYGYSNSHVVRDCIFTRHEYSLVNFGDVNLVEGCAFEGTGGAPPLGLRHMYLDDLGGTGSISGQTTWISNWCGDAFGAVPDYWIDLGQSAIRGWTWIYPYFGQKKMMISRRGGRGNLILGGGCGGDTDHLIDLGTTQHTQFNIFGGTDFTGLTNSALDPIKNRTASHNLSIYNCSFQSNHIGLESFQFSKGGQIGSWSAAPPTVTSIHANAGSGATCTFSGGTKSSSDLSGSFTLTTGTGTGAGTSNFVVFAHYQRYSTSFAPAPEVIVTAGSQATAALTGKFYGNGESATAWQLGVDTGTTLTASTAYLFKYHGIG